MERNSTNENIEHFLRQNADEFKMHPSPKVWEGISQNLNKRRRKFYFGLIALLISSSILGYTLLDFSFLKTGSSVTTPADETPLIPEKSAPDNKNAINKITALNGRSVIGNYPVRKNGKPASFINSSIVEPANSFSADLEMQRQYRIAKADVFNNGAPDFERSISLNKNLFDFNSLDRIENNQDLSIKARKRQGRFSAMFYFTPTVSYRKLSENKSYLRSSSLVGVPYNYAALYDINTAVTHKPDIGLEMGMTAKYSLTKNIKLRAGLQFNVNRYDIKAFKYTPEVATIALNNGSSRMQTLTTSSSYRNFNGGETHWLQNFSFQVSAPIGAEVKLHGNDKMYIGAASTIQPTYILGDRAYLITTDYKNYAQVPWLMRRWNVNTNLETFVAYSTGKLKWQVGPQIRYQLLSSFVDKYPVKENLFDFGLKVGISVNNNQ